MIKNILDMLNLHKAYRISENIEVAKGKYSIPTTFKEVISKITRELWTSKIGK